MFMSSSVWQSVANAIPRFKVSSISHGRLNILKLQLTPGNGIMKGNHECYGDEAEKAHQFPAEPRTA